MELSTITLGVGLLLLVLANILLGSISAIISRTWDWKKFRQGLIKGFIIVLALAAVFAAGYLNPQLVVIDYEGQQVNLMTAVILLLTAAYAVYAIDIIKKLRDILLKPKYIQLTSENNITEINDPGEPQKPPDEDDSADE